MATQPNYPLLTAGEFLEIDFHGRKAELDQGVIRMMAGGSARHSRVAGNIYRALGNALEGSGCTPYNSDMAIRTHDLSVRYPDVSVFCDRDGAENDAALAFPDPCIVVEVLSAGTARTDLTVKLIEYRSVSSVDTILYVDIAAERVRVVQRTGPHGWSDVEHDGPCDIHLPAVDVTLRHDVIFARN